jgi:hypothetical protein
MNRKPDKAEGLPPRRAIIVNEDYLDFIRSKPGLIEVGGRGPVDPDHLIARGTGEHKRNDYTAIPLYRNHHTERGQGNEKFEKKYGINLWQENSFLLMEYLQMKLTYQQSLTNVLQTAAQVRKAQIEYLDKAKKGNKDKELMIETKTLETALDMRLAELGIKAK